MPAVTSVASATNTYVPNHEASGNLVVGFSRNPDTFPISKYVKYVPAKQMNGLYLVWTSQEASRILTTNDREHNWADGDAAPTWTTQLESSAWYSFLTQRKAYPFGMGALAADQATWPIMAANGAVAAQKAMTARTYWAQSILTTQANWPTTNYAWVNPGGGSPSILPAGQNWSTGSVGYSSNPGPNIKTCMNYACIQIHKTTQGVVNPNKLCMVINPNTATLMAQSTEIQDFLKQNPDSFRFMQGGSDLNPNAQWGLPPKLYMVDICVEDTVVNTSNPGPNGPTFTYACPDGTAIFMAREGDLEGIEGAPNFSTMHVFFHKDELTVETKYDTDNRRYMGRVVSNYVPQLVAPTSGFLLQGLFHA